MLGVGGREGEREGGSEREGEGEGGREAERGGEGVEGREERRGRASVSRTEPSPLHTLSRCSATELHFGLLSLTWIRPHRFKWNIRGK